MRIQIIQASASLQLRSVQLFEPVLCQVEHGEKHLRSGASDYRVTSQDLAVLPAGSRLSVHNRAIAGCYRCVLVSMSHDVLQRFQQVYPSRALSGCRGAGPVVVERSGTLEQSWRHLLSLLHAQAPQEVCHLALFSVLMCLRLEGHDAALLHVRDEPAAQVERMLRADPASPWTAPQVAQKMHMSESHLRRQLAREGTSFRQLLETVRLGQALSELLSSRLPVAVIAHRCGYESGSRFARRFHQRFGVLPSEVRKGESEHLLHEPA